MEIASHINGEITGDSDLIIKGLCGIDSGRNQYISYIHKEQYFQYFSYCLALRLMMFFMVINIINGELGALI